eukprot:990473-Pleurochrysis_carterae.AAC.3
MLSENIERVQCQAQRGFLLSNYLTDAAGSKEAKVLPMQEQGHTPLARGKLRKTFCRKDKDRAKDPQEVKAGKCSNLRIPFVKTKGAVCLRLGDMEWLVHVCFRNPCIKSNEQSSYQQGVRESAYGSNMCKVCVFSRPLAREGGSMATAGRASAAGRHRSGRRRWQGALRSRIRNRIVTGIPSH